MSDERTSERSGVDALLAVVNAALACGDDAAAMAMIESSPPDVAVEAFDRAQRHWYWERKHLARVRRISRAGIGYATARAEDADDAAVAEQLLGRAKTLAYNLASFAWPGWDEHGIAPTAEDLADGRDAARLNLRLAIRLGRPDRALADAHWLIGAHALAAGERVAAIEAFREARAFAAAEPTKVSMLDGYAALAASLDDASALDRFDAIVADLRTAGDAGGSAYAEQLVTARRVLAR